MCPRIGIVMCTEPCHRGARILALRRLGLRHRRRLQIDPQKYGQTAASLGYRSALRIPIRVAGQLAGGVVFFSFAPSSYTKADVIVGRRVADRLALSLSREHAYESTKRADEAVQLAARLEMRVAA